MLARVLLGLLLVSVAVAPGAAMAADKPPPRPGVLWNKYPLGEQRLTGTTPTGPAPVTPVRRPSRPPPAAARTGGDDLIWLPIGLFAGAAVLLVPVIGSRVVRRLRRRGHTIASKRGRRAAMSKIVDESGQVSGQETRASQTVSDRVSGVIRAAEELAEQIRADAREEAVQIKSRADEAHAAATKRHAEELDRLRAAAEAEAGEVRRTAEIYATDHRRSAEAGTAKLLAEAEAQARAMREAAEQMAMQMETAALRRREELEQGTRQVETRLRDVQAGLREIASELDELLVIPKGKGGTLLQALGVGGEKAPAAEDGPAPTDTR